MDQSRIKIESSWKNALLSEFEKPYMHELRGFLKKEIEAKKSIFPKAADYFSAFNHTPIEKVKVVILGQDPYHGIGQAHGLSFSVKPGIKPPPSLENIFKELEADIGFERPDHGYLVEWANQGVLLLNATLSVESGRAGSHQKRGWENFTDAAIHYLNDNREHLVFILWGSYAQKKALSSTRKSISSSKRFIRRRFRRTADFSAVAPFSKANAYLKKHGKPPIDWRLSSKKDLTAKGLLE